MCPKPLSSLMPWGPASCFSQCGPGTSDISITGTLREMQRLRAADLLNGNLVIWVQVWVEGHCTNPSFGPASSDCCFNQGLLHSEVMILGTNSRAPHLPLSWAPASSRHHHATLTLGSSRNRSEWKEGKGTSLFIEHLLCT